MGQPIKPPKKLVPVVLAEHCNLCKSPGSLHPCSHVIPQWMYKTLPQDKRPMQIASSYAGEQQQKSPTGIYGSFVCPSCEKRFADWDDYAATVLRRNPEITDDHGRNFGQYDYAKMKRFFISLLWRAHACEHSFFENVALTAQEHLFAAACLLGEEKDILEEFEIVPTWSSHLLSYGVMMPVRVLIESVTYWQIYLPRFQALIKVEPGPGAPCKQPFAMINGTTNLYMHEKIFTEEEIHTVQRVVKENMKRKNEKRKNS